jgi:hypothetical protein
VTKVETPATSDVDAALEEKAGEYIALLLGMINALPKTAKPKVSPAPGGSEAHSSAGEHHFFLHNSWPLTLTNASAPCF